MLFQLLVFGNLVESHTGTMFSLTNDKRWSFYIEVPSQLELTNSATNNALAFIPLLSLLGKRKFVDAQEPYDFSEDDRLVCCFINAYLERHPEHGIRMIDQEAERHTAMLDVENWYHFDQDTMQAILFSVLELGEDLLPHVGKRKIHTKMCLRYLARRCKFLQGCVQFRYNMIPGLGSFLMRQFFREADHFCNMAVSRTAWQSPVIM
jgi:hypothetical protein